MRYVEEEEDEDKEDKLSDAVQDWSLNTVYVEPVQVNVVTARWQANMSIGTVEVDFKIDTGADVSIISERVYEKLVPRPRLRKSGVQLKAYNGRRIPSLGVYTVPVRYKERELALSVEVVPGENQPIVGAKDSERLGLVKRLHSVDAMGSADSLKESVRSKHPSLFQAHGALPGVHSFVVKEGATPVVHATQVEGAGSVG